MTFERTHYPDVNIIDRLSSLLNLSTERISVWFQNRRARFKKIKKPVNFNKSSDENDYLDEYQPSNKLNNRDLKENLFQLIESFRPMENLNKPNLNQTAEIQFKNSSIHNQVKLPICENDSNKKYIFKLYFLLFVRILYLLFILKVNLRRHVN